jgi:hypothetical protein
MLIIMYSKLRKTESKEPDIYLYYMKPSYQEAIRKEVATIKERKIHIIEDGQIIRL